MPVDGTNSLAGCVENFTNDKASLEAVRTHSWICASRVMRCSAGKPAAGPFKALARGVVTSALVTLHGKPVDDLMGADFVLTDDAKQQQITVTRDSRPLDVTLWFEQVAVDAWSDEIRSSLTNLAAHLDASDRVRVIVGTEFNREVLTWQSPKMFADHLDFKPDKKVHLRKFTAPSDQALFDTLMTLGPADRRQVVVNFFSGSGGWVLGDDVLAATAASSDAVVVHGGAALRRIW